MNETTQIHESPQCNEAMHSQTEGVNIPSLSFSIVERNGRKEIVIYCQECNTEIENYKSLNKKFCNDCLKKHKREWKKKFNEKHPNSWEKYKQNRWRKWELLGRKFEKRSLIDNCVNCGRDISIYPPHAKLCSHCREGDIFNLGTHKFSSHMRKKYDDETKTVVPDFEKERRAIDIQLKMYGLKRKKPVVR